VQIYNKVIEELDEICRETLKMTGKDREIFQFTDIGGIEPHLSPQVHSRTEKITQIHLPSCKTKSSTGSNTTSPPKLPSDE
jgi:hypothetical protein